MLCVFCQKNKFKYELKIEAKNTKKTFCCQITTFVKIPGSEKVCEMSVSGSGRSKKQASHNTSLLMLQAIAKTRKFDDQFKKILASENLKDLNLKQNNCGLNPISRLSQIVQAKSMSFPKFEYKESVENGKRLYTATCNLDDLNYTSKLCISKKEAKVHVASLVLEKLGFKPAKNSTDIPSKLDSIQEISELNIEC